MTDATVLQELPQSQAKYANQARFRDKRQQEARATVIDLRSGELKTRSINELDSLLRQVGLLARPMTREACGEHADVLRKCVEIGAKLFGWGQGNAPARLLSALMSELENVASVDVQSRSITDAQDEPATGELADCAPASHVATQADVLSINLPVAGNAQPVAPQPTQPVFTPVRPSSNEGTPAP